MADKQVEAIVSALAPQASVLVCTAVSSPRALPVDRLADAALRLFPATPVRAITPPAAALQFAQSLDSPVVVAGSLYLAGEIRGAIA
jgi:folylpolyglutamate synthase/dihydropteroate synthase